MTGAKHTSHDWFISAIVKDGTVGTCLGEVLTEVRRKERFVAKLHEKISERGASGADAISEISARIRVLENTLKFRLSILSPERRGAWFRANVATASGPFSGTVLPDPVFSQYDETKTNKVRVALIECWTLGNLIAYPMKSTESCLWKILLSLNFELQSLGNLGEWPRLERLPEDLPDDLGSRSLKAFLSNVALEYQSARERLKNAYVTLLDASDGFWARAKARRVDADRGEAYDGFTAAESMREEFRKRRAAPTIKRPIGKSTHDIEALRFMGFDDFPTADLLKQRYHTLALDMHPDRQSGNESRFKLLAKSYKHLSRVCER
ncbi:MAG: J domain-containing protein [Pseudomonadota bacterium]